MVRLTILPPQLILVADGEDVDVPERHIQELLNVAHTTLSESVDEQTTRRVWSWMCADSIQMGILAHCIRQAIEVEVDRVTRPKIEIVDLETQS